MNLININSYPVNKVLNLLLKDKTTDKNIIFATNTYKNINSSISETTEITEEILVNNPTLIQPRIMKSKEQQTKRTQNKAEVFTPAWLCNKMNNLCDNEWFGKSNVFNKEVDHTWVTTNEPIPFNNFNNQKNWQSYVNSRRLELTCGEAPYIVSRYDAATGDTIPIKDRIGLLDRKLRVINENTNNEADWLKWTYRAFQSVYGYEYQGDNLLIARINLLVTFVDYMQEKLKRIPTDNELKKIVNIIVWNFWQMDGLLGTVPFTIDVEKSEQLKQQNNSRKGKKKKSDDVIVGIDCKIYNWQSNKPLTYNSMIKEE